MVVLGGVISNLLSLGAKLLPAVNSSAQQASLSSSSPPTECQKIEDELQRLMNMLKRIKDTLYEAEQREIRDLSVRNWLKELKEVALEAEDVLDEYHYEVLRAEVDARDSSRPDSRKRKLIQVPHGMLAQIQQITSKFAEIGQDRIALQLFEEDGLRRHDREFRIAPTTHFVVESNIFGRDKEKEEIVKLFSCECHDSKVISVVALVGTGGLDKTTLAQLVYNDERIQKRFDMFGWICVSEDFDVQRHAKESVETLEKNTCNLTNLGLLQEKISEMVRGKRVLLVLDDIWNENINLWESFHAPFMSALLVKILVTTRSQFVHMGAQNILNLKYLPFEQTWQLFVHYAFGGINQNLDPNLVEIGKHIMKKCRMLSLVVKLIASLLRHDKNEESWREILESELWESDASDQIFRPLQISYTHLPTKLKPCFLYCLLFPKDYLYTVKELVELWIYQGYIEANGKKNAEEIGREFVEQLLDRCFLEPNDPYHKRVTFTSENKLHDIVHHLARLNSVNGYYSIEAGTASKLPISPNQICHLYVPRSVELTKTIPFGNFSSLRTLIICQDVQNCFHNFDISLARKLRVAKIQECQNYGLEFLSDIGNLKHLRYLSLSNLPFRRLPESICSLFKLQKLKLSNCHLEELPKNIGNLVSLEELGLYDCVNLVELPESFCQLKALRQLALFGCMNLRELPSDIGSLRSLKTLIINYTAVNSLPSSLNQILGVQRLHVVLECETIGWLENFVDLRGTLCLNNLCNLNDFQCPNLVSMHNGEYMILSWYASDPFSLSEGKNVWSYGNNFWLSIRRDHSIFLEGKNDFAVMASLQPHPNLRELEIRGYGGYTFPEWIGNPSSCEALEKLVIEGCQNLMVLPFGSLHKLKYLKISYCNSLRIIGAELLPIELEELSINSCRELIYVSGMQKLKSLVKLCIADCPNLNLLIMDAEPSVELTICTNKSWYQNSLLGLTNLTSLKSLQIRNCPELQLLGDALLCAESCEVEVCNCSLLRDWCLQHRINYKDSQPRESCFDEF